MPRSPIIAAREEWFLAVAMAVATAFFHFGGTLAAGAIANQAGATICLFAVLLGISLSVVRHAEHMAAQLGEPYGTLVLTLAVTFIEVVAISAMMSHGADNPALVRDTIFSVVMILLNFMVGLSLLLGGWRHLEQSYNLQGANAYLGVIIPITVLSLILPDFTRTTPGPTLSGAQEIFVALVSVGPYAIFLAAQTVRHRSYFAPVDTEQVPQEHPPHGHAWPAFVHALLLAAYLAPLVYLAECLSRPLESVLHVLQAPLPARAPMCCRGAVHLVLFGVFILLLFQA